MEFLCSIKPRVVRCAMISARLASGQAQEIAFRAGWGMIWFWSWKTQSF
jgi:hypothetical protein